MTDEKTENKTERVQLLMTPSEVQAIDDWGFSRRIRTRAEAIRRLCRIGIVGEDALRGLLKSLHDHSLDFNAEGKPYLDKLDGSLTYNELARAYIELFYTGLSVINRTMVDVGEAVSVVSPMSVGSDIENSLRLSEDIQARIKAVGNTPDDKRKLVVELLKALGGEAADTREAPRKRRQLNLDGDGDES